MYPYLCSMARSYGLSQLTIKNPSRIYPQGHDPGEMAPQPATNYGQHWSDTKRMLRSKKPIILNDDNWGLGQEDLRQKAIG